VLHDRLELPSPDYKTGVLPRELIEHDWSRRVDSNHDFFLDMEFYVAVSTLVRVDLFKRPNR